MGINLAFIILPVLACVNAQIQNVTIETNVGTFIGYRQTVNTGKADVLLDKFLGIPFAEPPVGNLRFRKPVPLVPLPEPFIAHRHGAACIQADVFGTGDPMSEDCLFLNVYAPVRSNAVEKLPVFVWVYGGGFLFGSSDAYVADLLATVGNVVVVTFNYRLFALGFLNVPGTDSDANCGLWDQHLAIKWVSDNIDKFGGDRTRVTIAGESAGAASVIYQGFYPGNVGLFHRIIAQSGTSAVSWAYTEKPLNEAKDYARLVGCPTNNSQALVTCMRELSLEKFKEKIIEVAFSAFPIPFRPSLDNEFVTVSPYDMLNKSLDVGQDARATFAAFDLLTGVNAAEGGGLLGPTIGVDGDINTFMPTKAEFDAVLAPICVNITLRHNADKVPLDYVLSEYTAWNDDPLDPLNIRGQLVDMYSDALYVAPMYRTLDLHANLSDKHTYMYHFTLAPSTHLFPFATWIEDSAHGDELLYLFGEAAEFRKLGYMGQLQPWEKEDARSVMKLWAHFARTGNMGLPNELGLNWPQYTLEDQRYLEIVRNVTQSVVKQRLDAKRVNLWNRLLPKYVENYVPPKKCEDDATSDALSIHATSLVLYAMVSALLVHFAFLH